MIGPISPDVKQMGARSAGNPHAACDVEGAGNVARSGCLGQLARQSSTLPGEAVLHPVACDQVRGGTMNSEMGYSCGARASDITYLGMIRGEFAIETHL